MVLGGASGGGGGHKHVSADALSRTRSRDMDIAESYYLLLELGTQEPVMQHCIKTLQGICLAQGVKLASKGVHDQDPATKKWDSGATTQFQKHIDKYFVAFCEEAIRCFYVCGFVPWHVRRLASTGDLVPEVLPLGTFTWYVELRTEKEKRNRMEEAKRRQREVAQTSYLHPMVDPSSSKPGGGGPWGKPWHNPPARDASVAAAATPAATAAANSNSKTAANTANYTQCDSSVGRREGQQDQGECGHPAGGKRVREDSETKYVQYRVSVTDGGLLEEEVYIYDYIPAKYDISKNSMMYATVPSPISHIIIDYKNLRQAQIRRSHADAWNTQSHLITSFSPSGTSNNMPEWKGFNFGPQDRDTRVPAADGNAFSLLFDTSGESEVSSRDSLIRRQVVQGRPHDPVVYTLPKHSEVVQTVELKPVEDIGLLMEKYSRDVAFVLGIPPNFVVSKSSLSSSSSSSQQGENTHTFTTNAQNVCRHLERLLSDVHEVVYGEPADFSIVPMPRISIETMDDIKTLMETGLMLPEKAVRITDILLGAQNLPISGEEGGQHARKVQKLILEKPAAAGAAGGGKKKKKSK